MLFHFKFKGCKRGLNAWVGERCKKGGEKILKLKKKRKKKNPG